jgi:hypothetical protein
MATPSQEQVAVLRLEDALACCRPSGFKRRPMKSGHAASQPDFSRNLTNDVVGTNHLDRMIKTCERCRVCPAHLSLLTRPIQLGECLMMVTKLGMASLAAIALLISSVHAIPDMGAYASAAASPSPLRACCKPVDEQTVTHRDGDTTHATEAGKQSAESLKAAVCCEDAPVCCQLGADCCTEPSACCVALLPCCAELAACCLEQESCCELAATCCLVQTDCGERAVACGLPQACCLDQADCCLIAAACCDLGLTGATELPNCCEELADCCFESAPCCDFRTACLIGPADRCERFLN